MQLIDARVAIIANVLQLFFNSIARIPFLSVKADLFWRLSPVWVIASPAYSR
ncbi:hypothetical protein [Collimonas silvisoli]|uniref:hypothetical protein n=1 Tax=Collimonas silvisoli TaxID=2825884 RepID=UPI001B8CF36C|nr:hypothetical protein [Collimonas silvisoli]